MTISLDFPGGKDVLLSGQCSCALVAISPFNDPVFRSRILVLTPFTAIAMSATLAPRIEIYTMLACSVHKPDIFERSYMSSFMPSALNSNLIQNARASENLCASDPVVQAAVAKLTAGEWLILAKEMELSLMFPYFTVITTTMGVIGCLTTAWWGSVSAHIPSTAALALLNFQTVLRSSWSYSRHGHIHFGPPCR